MTKQRIVRIGIVGLSVFGLISPILRADEGLWTFDKPPVERLKEKYGFEPPVDWFVHLQRSCVRVGEGGSGSFVSPNGLVMTNHHVAWDQIQKLSTAERDLLENGFYARTPEEELKCPDLEVRILWSISDVTSFIVSPDTLEMEPADRYVAERKRIAHVVTQAEKATGLQCEVVPLYGGARYHLYRYQRYTDVRLVMAPERTIAQFGGDADNFDFPRFCFDVCFLRVYDDNGQPLNIEHYLRWSNVGAADGDFVFVAGHPHETHRLYTVDHLKHLRDFEYPRLLNLIWRREVQLQTFMAQSAEHARAARGELAGYQNARKSLTGTLTGLYDRAMIRRKTETEHALREAVGADPDHQKRWGDAWDQVIQARQTERAMFPRYNALEGRAAGGGSQLYAIAKHLVRMGHELQKRNPQRLPEYSDTSLDSLLWSLYSPAPIDDDLEIDRLASGLSYLAEQLGADDPLVTKMWSGKAPHDRAVELVQGSTLKDVGERKRTVESGNAALIASTDRLVRLLYDVEVQAWPLLMQYKTGVEAVDQGAYAKIAAAQFALGGDNIYPDGTGTLRLSWGSVQGYTENDRAIPPFTTLGGMFERHGQRGSLEPFGLPRRWLEGKGRLDISTPFNFVSTADIAGGNSGSPVVNRQGEVVGLIFDGNAYTHVWDVAYDDERGRSVAVDSRAIIEALRKIYDADRLADEITGRSLGATQGGG